MATLHVTLAEVPTDVLVHLVDSGPRLTVAQIAAAIAPPEAHDAESSVRSGLRLLMKLGYVGVGMAMEATVYTATSAGHAAVTEARAANGEAGDE